MDFNHDLYKEIEGDRRKLIESNPEYETPAKKAAAVAKFNAESKDRENRLFEPETEVDGKKVRLIKSQLLKAFSLKSDVKNPVTGEELAKHQTEGSQGDLAAGLKNALDKKKLPDQNQVQQVEDILEGYSLKISAIQGRVTPIINQGAVTTTLEAFIQNDINTGGDETKFHEILKALEGVSVSNIKLSSGTKFTGIEQAKASILTGKDWAELKGILFQELHKRRPGAVSIKSDDPKLEGNNPTPPTPPPPTP